MQLALLTYLLNIKFDKEYNTFIASAGFGPLQASSSKYNLRYCSFNQYNLLSLTLANRLCAFTKT